MALHEIYTAQDLRKFRDIVNDGNYNLNAILMNDIYLQGNRLNQWIPIYRPSGVFDGNGHTISGLYINTNDSALLGVVDAVGFVSYTAMISYSGLRVSFTVKNLTIEGNIILKSASAMQNYAGGIIARISDGASVNIISCKNKVNITLGRNYAYVGGIYRIF